MNENGIEVEDADDKAKKSFRVGWLSRLAKWISCNSSVCWGAVTVGFVGAYFAHTSSVSERNTQVEISTRERETQNEISNREDKAKKLTIALSILRAETGEKTEDSQGMVEKRSEARQQILMWAGKEFLLQIGAFDPNRLNGEIVPEDFMKALRGGEIEGSIFDVYEVSNPKKGKAVTLKGNQIPYVD